MIIMEYYDLGDLTYYITKDFFKISWFLKLEKLYYIITGLSNIHDTNIIHKDYHSRNIFLTDTFAVIGDLGISKSALEDNNGEIYGIIPYIAPEVFQKQKYTKSSDIYSFGMIMWELITGRKPFWNQIHDTDLIIRICDGLRSLIVSDIGNVPEGYIELMQECWDPDSIKRPAAVNLMKKIKNMRENEYINSSNSNPTKIIKSLDIGPVIVNHPGAIYKSRSLS